MNTDMSSGRHDGITDGIIKTFYEVYNELGSGFLESVYQEGMRIALLQAGMRVKTQVPVPVHFRGAVIGVFRADLIVNDVVLVELKACAALVQEHQSQTLHYLRATDVEVALLMNFGPKPTFKRLMLDNSRKLRLERSVSSVAIGDEPSPEEAR